MDEVTGSRLLGQELKEVGLGRLTPIADVRVGAHVIEDARHLFVLVTKPVELVSKGGIQRCGVAPGPLLNTT